MAVPTSYKLLFGKGKTTLSAKEAASVTAMGSLLKSEPATRLMLSAYADTSAKKTQNEALAKKRLGFVKDMLTKTYGIAAERILVETRPQKFAAAKLKDSAGVLQRLDVQVMGLQPLVLSSLESSIAAPGTDERARFADSLAAGVYSKPFFYKVAHSIVRKDGVELARQKTFEEAGAEVSSSFQDFESKRLEADWLSHIKQYSPVIEHKELLKNAFAKTP
jgi:hypothetical protein